MIKILIVDDENRIRTSLEGLLRDAGYLSVSCESGETALQLLKDQSFDVVFLDVMLPGVGGIETLQNIMKFIPEIKVLMMSGHADIATAVKATRLGAIDFFEKPLNPDRVLLSLKSIKEKLALEQKVVALENLVDVDEMVGETTVMKELKESIRRAAPSEGRVLVYGENGTGKELVAKAIHLGSQRKDRSFVSINCAALPKDLVESELFGYEKGAFTGAVRRKPGRFETADGGTLFLDEIGDMNLETQAKLLRVLQENEAVRIGGSKPYQFDVRIVSATNKNLTREIERGQFREDLLYRLNVVPINVPSLRERKNDIPILVDYFLKKILSKTGKRTKTIDRDAVGLLVAYDWPGNVRELKNIVERLIIMNDADVIQGEQVRTVLPSQIVPRQIKTESIMNGTGSLRDLLQAYEKSALVQGYEKAGGNVSELARLLKVDRANLHRKLKLYGIK